MLLTIRKCCLLIYTIPQDKNLRVFLENKNRKTIWLRIIVPKHYQLLGTQTLYLAISFNILRLHTEIFFFPMKSKYQTYNRQVIKSKWHIRKIKKSLIVNSLLLDTSALAYQTNYLKLPFIVT